MLLQGGERESGMTPNNIRQDEDLMYEHGSIEAKNLWFAAVEFDVDGDPSIMKKRIIYCRMESGQLYEKRSTFCSHFCRT